MATMSTIDATPQAIPAIVRKLRILLRARLEADLAENFHSLLLQDHLLAFAQATHDLRLRPIADAGHDGDPLSSFFQKAGSGTSTSVDLSFL